MSLRPRFMFSVIMVMMPITVLLLVYGHLDANQLLVLQIKAVSTLASRIIEGNLAADGDVAAAARRSSDDICHLGIFKSWAVTDSGLEVLHKVNASELSGRLAGPPLGEALIEGKPRMAGDLVGVPLTEGDSTVGGFWARIDPSAVRQTFPASRAAALVLVMVLAMAFITLITYTAVSVQILGPLEKLSQGARRVASGDYSRPVNAPGAKGEAEQLVDAFNKMMAQVRDARTSLQSRIDDAKEKIVEGERHLARAQKLAAAGQLAAGVAHEINNPLGGMMNVTKKMQSGALDDAKRREYLELLRSGLDSIKATVDKLLGFAPRTAGVSSVDLAEVSSDAIALVAHYASERGVEITRTIEDGLEVQADAEEIKQVFVNLLLNAIDAATGKGTVEIAARRAAGTILVRFEDDGKGMTENEISHAFEAFYTTKEPGKGSGLGLPIASSIVERYGGETRIESERGKGTTVILEFREASSGSVKGGENES